MRFLKTTLIFICSLFILSSANAVDDFAKAKMWLEYNANDRTAKVVFDIATNPKVKKIQLTAPGGRVVQTLTSRDTRSLFAKKFFAETGADRIARVKVAYPEGTYVITATTAEDIDVTVNLSFSHVLPDNPSLVTPVSDSTISSGDLITRWRAVPAATGYQLNLSKTDLSSEIEIDTNADARRFTFNSALFQAGTEYSLSLAAIASNGNRAVRTISFTTAD